MHTHLDVHMKKETPDFDLARQVHTVEAQAVEAQGRETVWGH